MAIAATLPLATQSFKTTSASVKIVDVKVIPAHYPMTGYFKFFAGASGKTGRAAVFVKVTADDGTVGWGQSVPIPKWSYETPETATVVLRDYFAPAVIGMIATDMSASQTAL